MVLTPKITVVPDTKYHGMRWHRGMCGSISCNIGEIAKSHFGLTVGTPNDSRKIKAHAIGRDLTKGFLLYSPWKVIPSLREGHQNPNAAHWHGISVTIKRYLAHP